MLSQSAHALTHTRSLAQFANLLTRHSTLGAIFAGLCAKSTVDAMADAIDQSSVICYGVSREYKESANCKLEGKACKPKV